MAVAAVLWMASDYCHADSDAPIEVTVATNKTSYVLGDPIAITVAATNTSDESIRLWFSDSQQGTYLLDDFFDPTAYKGALFAFTHLDIAANDKHVWRQAFPWWYPLEIGEHHLVGKVIGHASSEEHRFSVVDREQSTEDIFIDFESLPDGTPTSGKAEDGFYGSNIWEHAYYRLGIRFPHSGNRTLWSGAAGDRLMKTRVSPDYVEGVWVYEPGVIETEFETLVYQVAAEVSTYPGLYASVDARDGTVILEAYSLSGDLLGSLSAEAYGDPSRLAFSSPEPIASVRWVSGSYGFDISIDNLSLGATPTQLPEPTTTVCFGSLVAMLVASHRRGLS